MKFHFATFNKSYPVIKECIKMTITFKKLNNVDFLNVCLSKVQLIWATELIVFSKIKE